MENKEQKSRKLAIGAGIAVGAVLVLLIALGIIRARERAAYHAEMQRLESLYESMAAERGDSEASVEPPGVDMADEYNYGGNAAANLYHSYEDGKLAKLAGDETVYYYADNAGNMYRKSLSDSEWEIVIRGEGAGKNIIDLNVDNTGGQYVYYKYQDESASPLRDNGIYRLNVETLEEQLVVGEGQGEPDEPRLMNGKLYYLRDDKDLHSDVICCMDLETLKEEILFKPTGEYYSIYDFSVTGDEIIFVNSDDAVMKLTMDGKLSTLYAGEYLGDVIPCEGKIYFMDYASEHITSVYEMDYDGNLAGTYEIGEPYVELIYVKDGYLYGYKYAGDNMLIKVHMNTGNQEMVLDYPEDMSLYFVNIVDDTMLLELCTSKDDCFLIDLYALPVGVTDMTLEDCVHLQQMISE